MPTRSHLLALAADAMTEPTQAERLAEPFAPEMLRTLNKGGTNLSYIPVAEVIARLNNVCGHSGWSYRIVERWSAGEWEATNGSTYPEWCMAHVRLVVGEACHDGVGGVQVKRLNNGNGPVDMGDEWKGAVSDALKKAAQAFGIGLDIARKDEAKAADAQANEAQQADAVARECGWDDAQERNAAWNRLVREAKELPEDDQALIRKNIKKAGFGGHDFTREHAKWWGEQIQLASPAGVSESLSVKDAKQQGAMV